MENKLFVVPEFDYQWDILGRNVLLEAIAVVAAVLSSLTVAMPVKNTRFFSRLTLATTQQSEQGYTVQVSSVAERYLHCEGTTETALRPSGKVHQDDEVIPAESEGGSPPGSGIGRSH